MSDHAFGSDRVIISRLLFSFSLIPIFSRVGNEMEKKKKKKINSFTHMKVHGVRK